MLFARLCVVALTLGSSLADASEWTRFRGPNGTGVNEAAEIPVEWKDDNILYRTKLPGGSGAGSPVIWSDKAFVLSADPETATRYVVCIDAIKGDILWQKEYASQPHHLHTRSSYASCTPAVDEDRVYVAWSTPEQTTLRALKHDGTEVWTKDLGTWQSQHGFGTSPIVYKDLLILHNSQQASQLKEGEKPGESRMMAFNRQTGDLVWKTELESVNVCYSVPMIYSPPDGGPDQLICTSTGNGIFSLDPVTGKENWSHNDQLFVMRTVSSPIEAGGLLFGSNGSGAYSGNYLVAIKPGQNAALAYKLENSNKFKAPYVPCLIAKDNLLFCLYDRGFASCVKAQSGEILWMERTNAQFSGSPVRTRDCIYCTDEKGVVWVFAASGDYKLLAQNELGEESWSTPAIANNRLYVRTIGHLVSVGAK
jgi:outer membrane protein assembly factor BamB